MKKCFNSVRLAGYLYDAKLEEKVTGPSAKTPGVTFISGSIDIATDDELTNIVTVHYPYVAPTNSKGDNPLYKTLSNIMSGVHKTVLNSSKEDAYKLRADTALAVNDYYTERDGQEVLVSYLRNEGGFLHNVQNNTLPTSEDERDLIDVDMIITKVMRVEADPDKPGTVDFVRISGGIFDFRNNYLPVEFKVTSDRAMDYFENKITATEAKPFFTHIRGREISSVIRRVIVEEGAFGEDSVREVTSTRRERVIHWATNAPYVFGDEEAITEDEYKAAIAARETHLAEIKARYDSYKANRGSAIPQAAKAATVTPKATTSEDTWNF